VRTLWLLARLRFRENIHSPATAVLYLGMPMALLVIVGLVFANGHPFERKTLAVVGELPPATATALARYPDVRLRHAQDREVAFGKLRTRAVHGVLIAPGDDAHTQLWVGPREELFGRGVASVLDGIELKVAEVPRWGYVHFLFPGLITITIMIAGVLGMGYGMVRYRGNQFLKKLSTTPLRRATFIAAQLGARSTLVLGQLALMVAAGVIVFHLPLTVGSALWLAGLSLLGLLTFSGAGFILACAIRNEANVLDVVNVVMMPLVFFSEIFFSVEELPVPLARVAAALPSTQLVRMLRAVVLYGERSPAELATGGLILVAWAFATFAVAVHRFRWHDQERAQ